MRRALLFAITLLLVAVPIVAAAEAPAEAYRVPLLRLLTAHAASPETDTVRFVLATNRACEGGERSIELRLEFRVNGQQRTTREPVTGCPDALVIERALFLAQGSAPARVHLELAQLVHSTGEGTFPFSELRPDGPHDSLPDVATLVPASADIWPRLHYGIFLVAFAALVALRARMTDPLRVRVSSSRP